MAKKPAAAPPASEQAAAAVAEPSPAPQQQEEPFSWKPLLADRLVGKDKDGKIVTVPTSSLVGKHVLVYFSAHWCVVCGRWGIAGGRVLARRSSQHASSAARAL